MDVILKADVKGLGKKGEKVKASDGYARNFIFPKGLAVEANAQSLTELRNREQSNQHKIDVEVAAANESKAKLQGKTFPFVLFFLISRIIYFLAVLDLCCSAGVFL